MEFKVGQKVKAHPVDEVLGDLGYDIEGEKVPVKITLLTEIQSKDVDLGF